MGLFRERHDDDKEREAARHRSAQQRLAEARRHQQGRETRTATTSPASRQHGSYPEGSWRKEFDLHVVRKGDTLSGIAKQVYGDGEQWYRIQEANPIVLKNPDLVHPGLVLRIPKGEAKPLA
jgi:nucleoid-associated protein YgaU